jgi:hypothetical protein
MSASSPMRGSPLVQGLRLSLLNAPLSCSTSFCHAATFDKRNAGTLIRGAYTMRPWRQKMQQYTNYLYICCECATMIPSDSEEIGD